MCRLAGYLGEPLALAALSDEAPHALYRQSYAAKELESAVVCADGWGAAWYLPESDRACLYRSTLPIWADVNRADLGRTIRSHCLLAAVRSATDPSSIAHANTQPFASERVSVVHNGYVENFAPLLLGPLRAGLSTERHAEIRGNTDSEHLAALVFDEHARGAPSSPGERLIAAVRRALSRFEELVSAARTKAILSLVVSDGERMAGVRAAIGGAPPSLYHCRRPGGWLLASEPLDDHAAWTALSPRRLFVAERRGAHEELAL